MIDPVFQTDNYQLARKLLDATALRHEAIATNIANAETPGYRRLDVSSDFAQQLKTSLENGGLASGSTEQLSPRIVEDTNARSLRPDGNSVEMEHELLAMNKNAVEFDYLSEVVSTNLKQLRVAISGRT